jgi:hypothetical protein
MTDNEFARISDLEGLEFIQALLEIEKSRFDDSNFRTGSTFEDVNADFGIFPATRAYPVYFAGDIREPRNKIVIMGINPGFHAERYAGNPSGDILTI